MQPKPFPVVAGVFLFIFMAAQACSDKFQEKDGRGGFGNSYRVGNNRQAIDKVAAAEYAGFQFLPDGLDSVVGNIKLEYYTDKSHKLANDMVKITLEIDNNENDNRNVQLAFFDTVSPDPFWLFTVTGKANVPVQDCRIASAAFVHNNYLTIQAF